MKKVLILEDDPIRHKAFKKNFWRCDMTIVETAQDAIKELINNKFDYLFLDHDLGGTQFAPSDENSGYGVAKFLKEHKEFQPTVIVLHSLNPAGRLAMKHALPNAYEQPLIWNLEIDFNNGD